MSINGEALVRPRSLEEIASNPDERPGVDEPIEVAGDPELDAVLEGFSKRIGTPEEGESHDDTPPEDEFDEPEEDQE